MSLRTRRLQPADCDPEQNDTDAETCVDYTLRKMIRFRGLALAFGCAAILAGSPGADAQQSSPPGGASRAEFGQDPTNHATGPSRVGEGSGSRGTPAGPPAAASDSRPAPPPAASTASTARRVTPPPKFAGGLDVQNQARASAGRPPLIWSVARAEEAQAALASIAGQTCSRGSAERLGAAKELATYWAPASRMLGGVGAAQNLSSQFIASEWLSEKASYDPIAGCRLRGACDNYSRIIRASATTVGCGMTICADQSQIWACRFGD